VGNGICADQNLFFPKVLKQKGLQRLAVSKQLRPLGLPTPVERKIAIDHSHAIIDDFIVAGKVITTNILVYGAASA